MTSYLVSLSASILSFVDVVLIYEKSKPVLLNLTCGFVQSMDEPVEKPVDKRVDLKTCLWNMWTIQPCGQVFG